MNKNIRSFFQVVEVPTTEMADVPAYVIKYTIDFSPTKDAVSTPSSPPLIEL